MNSDIRSGWLSSLFSTEPADRPRAEAALRDLYAAVAPAPLPPPTHFFWFDSPVQAAWAVAVLNTPYDKGAAPKPGPEILKATRARLCQSAQRDWEGVTSLAGELQHIYYRCMAARQRFHNNKLKTIHNGNSRDVLWRVENSLRLVSNRQRGQPLVPYLESSFQQEYSFYMMAVDESDAQEQEAPPFLRAAWEVARSAGYWWPFRGAVVLSERPAEIHVNKNWLLHREDGPAAVLRDGTRLWAWNGNAMEEEWILDPEKIRPADLRQLDQTFRKYVEARVESPKPKLKPSAILKQELPTESEKRVVLLRRHNRGSLPFFDRYMGGEHQKVWEELIALGPSVREDPHAADALAVAYETMRRVRENVRTITARLKALGYEKERGTLHQAPSAKSRQQIPRLEKTVGGMPISLRTFYDVVGAVDWMGHHPGIAPRDGSVTPDPLVVESVENALSYYEDGDDQGHIIIAPDGAIKAGAHDGELYLMEVPNQGADGKLVNERHNAGFVEYLRVAFRFGGFPGYDGKEPGPRQLKGLRQGLLEF